MTDDRENEIVVDVDTPETFIADGEVWIPDGPALIRKLGAAYLYFVDGDLYAGIAGGGDYLVRDLLADGVESARPKLASVKSIK